LHAYNVVINHDNTAERHMNVRLATATILATMGLAQNALAQDPGEWLVRSGFYSMQPKSHSHPLFLAVEKRRQADAVD
jgi:outer membrane protein W